MNPLIAKQPALAAAFDAAGFPIVDVGARGGAFAPFRRLAPWVHYCAFEPDSREAARLGERMGRSGWQRVTVVPKALADREDTVELYMTEHEGFSSVLRPREATARRFCDSLGFGVRSVVRVPAATLKTAAEQYGFEDACFVKLDTQGSELRILESGSAMLERSVLGLYVEMLLQPFYADQPSVGSVLDYLTSRGFSLVDLQRTFMRRAGHDGAVFSRRQVVWAHALFMREPDHPSVLDAEGGLARYVGLSIAFDYFDLALEAIRTAVGAGRISSDLGRRLTEDVLVVARERTTEVLGHLPGPIQAADVLACAQKDRRAGPQ